jgi:hypothetical protein
MTIIKLTMDTLTLINVIAMWAVEQVEGLNQWDQPQTINVQVAGAVIFLTGQPPWQLMLSERQ